MYVCPCCQLAKMTAGLRSRLAGHVFNITQTNKSTEEAIASGVDMNVERTDPNLWRLKVEHGRQTWHYITPQQAETWPQTIPEKYHLGMETVTFPQLHNSPFS